MTRAYKQECLVTENNYKKALLIVQRYEQQEAKRKEKNIILKEQNCVDLITESQYPIRLLNGIRAYLKDEFNTEYDLSCIPKSVLLKINIFKLGQYRNIGKASLYQFKNHIETIR